MISELRIAQLGVISEATLPLGPGFTVVTGETGAGKTMVVTALGLLLGARSDAGVVRLGAANALAEARLEMPVGSAALHRAEEAGAQSDEFDDVSELVISRSVSAEGRSRAHVGGRTVPIGVLSELGEMLVTVHGQSDQLRLKSAVAQREALDAFADNDDALEEYRERYEAWHRAIETLNDVRSNTAQRSFRAEQLRSALQDIDMVEPAPGEEETLKAESIKLTNVESLRQAANLALNALQSEEFADVTDVSTLLDGARRAMDAAVADDPELGGLAQRLDEVLISVSDIATDLGAYAARLDDDAPTRLAEVEDRRGALAALTRKYAPTIDEVIAFRDSAQRELDELEDREFSVEALEETVSRTRQELLDQAAVLSSRRNAAAQELSSRVSAELKALAMPDAALLVAVEATEPASHGADDISFLLQPHQGSAPRPLGKGASGGELSRVMLALEVVLAESNPVPTFVFDEVDSGVGGKAAVEIGRRLAMLAQHVQVLVVTHLPQVAAFADQHVRVKKSSDGGLTSSDVALLDTSERKVELARMLAGQEDSTAAQAHAEELLAEAALIPQRARK